MRLLLVTLMLCLTSGCFTTKYLAQAAGGQLQLLRDARPLGAVLEDPKTTPEVRALLAKVPAIKRFGQFHGLTPTENYRTYVDLHRSAAVYVVQGCAPLAFEPKRWSFPIVGSVPYLGFFDPAAAKAFAAQLERDEHLDVTVRTAAAYSTLGWFKDSVLSTMLHGGADAFPELANTILHESVHATVYVPSQSAFNESLASFIADELTWQLMVGRFGLGSAEVQGWFEEEARSQRFLAELRLAHDELDALYRSALSDDVKRAKKEERLNALQKSLGLKRKYNNADLAGVRTYETGNDAFRRLYLACGSVEGVMKAVKQLKERDFERPQQAAFDDVVDALAKKACASRPRQ